MRGQSWSFPGAFLLRFCERGGDIVERRDVLSMSASVCCTDIVHCSSHQYGCAITPRLTMPNQ